MSVSKRYEILVSQLGLQLAPDKTLWALALSNVKLGQ